MFLIIDTPHGIQDIRYYVLPLFIKEFGIFYDIFILL